LFPPLLEEALAQRGERNLQGPLCFPDSRALTDPPVGPFRPRHPWASRRTLQASRHHCS